MLLIAGSLLAFNISQLAYGQSSDSLEKATTIHYDPIIRRLIVYIQESLPKELGNMTATVVVWRRPDKDMSGVVQKQVLFNRILQGVENRLSTQRRNYATS